MKIKKSKKTKLTILRRLKKKSDKQCSGAQSFDFCDTVKWSHHPKSFEIEKVDPKVVYKWQIANLKMYLARQSF